MEKIATSSERLKALMQKLFISQSDIVKATGLTKSAISQYVNGQREPRQDAVGIICEKYRVNPTWFMGYDAPMFLDDTMNYITSDNYELSPSEKTIIDIYRSATDEEKRMLIEMCAFFKSKKQDD